MSYRDADLYGDVADVLEALHDTVDSYVLFLQEGEDREREYAAAVAGTAGPSAGPPSPSLSTSTAREQALTRQYIRDSVPRLMELCTSVQATLRAAARTMPNKSASRRSAGPSTPAPLSSSSSRAEAGRVLVTRKLGDVMENAHMMRGLVKVQRQRQLLPRASIGSTPTMMDGEDEDDGPLRMKQLIRVTQYNLEDTERLLRLAYPEGGPIDMVAQGDDGNSDNVDANSPPLSRSPTARRGLTQSSGVRNCRYGGSVEPASNSPGSASSPSETPRSSAHTAPYVRRSVSQEPFSVPTSYVFPPPSSTPDANGGRHGAHDSSNSNVVELGDEDGARMHPGSSTGIVTPRSILARSRHGDGNASTASRNTSRTSSPRVHFAIDEPANCPSQDNHSQRSAGAAAAASAGPAAALHQVADRPAAMAVAVPRDTNAAATADAGSSLSDAALAATATPARPQPRRGSGLLSNPVVRRSSTESDDAMSTSGGPLLFTSSPFRSSDHRVGLEHAHEHDDSASGVMRLAPFGLRSDSQTSLPFASGSSGSASSAAQTSSSTTATGTNGRGSGGDGADHDESDAGAAAAAAAASTSSLPSAPMHPAPAFATSNGYGGGVTRHLSLSATPSVLSMATISVADAPRGILRTAPSRGSSAASATSTHGYTAHRDSGGGQSGASGPLPWQSTHAHVANHCSTSASGSSGSVRPVPMGLPPRSPRQHEEQRLSLSCASAPMGQHSSLPLPRGDPDARVVTRHMQRLPGELWATILASHRAEMEDVVREDVVDFFNYGEAVPVLRNEGVCDVHFTVVDTHLYIRVKLEHAQALTEAEINLRLGLCSFPLMTALYEEFFREYQAKEFDPIEGSSTTLNSSTMWYSDARSSVRTGRNSISDDHYHNGGDSDGDSKSDGPLRKESTFAPDPTTPRSGGVNAFTTAGAAAAAAPSADPNSADAPGPTSPLSIDTNSRTVSVAGDSTAASYIFGVASPRSVHTGGGGGGGGGGHHRSDSEAESFAVTPTSVEPTAAAAAEAVLQKGRSVSYVSVIADAPVAPSSSSASTQQEQQQQRHSHTVRLPGVHWSQLAASNVPAMADLGAAFVTDAGAALGVLPSEARAACQDVRLSYGGGLVVDVAWDNGELYPGAHWLTAPEVAAALSSCLFPSVRAVYAAACAAWRFDNDLAAAAAAAWREGTGGKARSRDVVQLILPAKSELDHKSSLRGSSSNTTTPDRVALKQHQQQQQILLSPSASPTTMPNFAGTQQQHASSPLAAITAPTTTRVAPSSKSASASLRLVPTSSAAGLRPRLAVAPAVAAEEESGSSTASQSASLHGQQQPPPPPASAFDRANSAASLASVEAEPRMAVPQPTIIAASHTARKSSDARAAGGASRPQRPPPSRAHAAAAAPASAATAAAAAAAAAPAPEPQTLNQLSVVHGVSLAVLRQWNPALAELDAGAVIPASATVCVPRVTSTSPARKIRIDAPAAATTAAATAQRRVQSPRQARADARPPAPALPPQPVQQQQQQQPSTATTQAPPSHADPAATASTKGSAAPLPTPATNKVKQHRAQPSAAPHATEPAAQHPQAAEPTAAPLAAEALVKSTREASPRMPPPAKATSSQPQSAAPPLTAAPAPSRKVYQLPITMSARPDEPRGIDVLLASQSALRLFQEGGAAATTAGGVPVDTDERTASSSVASEEVTAAAVERELGMRLDGLLVSTVRRGSIAARACVQAGDTLRTLDGQPLIAQSDFLRGMARQHHLQRQRLKNSGGSGEFTVFVTATTPRGIPTTYRLRLPPMQRDEVQPTSTQPAAAAATAATMPTGPSPQRMARLGVPPPPPTQQQQQQQHQPTRRVASVTAQARGLERPLSIGPAARQHPPAATVAAAAARTGTPTSARLRVSSTGASARPMRAPSSRPKLRDPQQEQQQQQQHVEAPDTLHAVTSGGVQPVSARRLTRDGVGSAARMRGPHT